MILHWIVSQIVREGNLTFIKPNGKPMVFGNGKGSPIVVRIKTNSAMRGIALNPRLRVGEAYMDGSLVIESGSLYEFMELVAINSSLPYQGFDFLRNAINFFRRRLAQWNPEAKSKQNVAHHYDLSNDFYRLWLDEDMQYSCAYFRSPGSSLTLAQIDKKKHIAAKLLLQPRMKVLDIGCGWGGMAITLAKDYGVSVLGVTLSERQLVLARERAKAAGVEKLVKLELRDYRSLIGEYGGKFDRIVSVGMFEHVGVPHYEEYFDHVRELRTPEGVALIHTIGRWDGPSFTNAWVRRYIFPGGYSPALSEIMPVIEKSGLVTTDIELLRLHYAETLSAWRGNFIRQLPKVEKLFDQKFIRMWEFYLIGSEMAFRYGGHAVFQIQLTRQLATVPLTRDYIATAESGGKGK